MEFFHERAGAVVDGLAGEGAVVGVHDAVDEAETHPMRDELGLGGDDAFEEGEGGVGCVGCFGVVAVDGVVREGAEGIVVFAGSEVLEGSDAEVAGGDAGEDAAHDVAFLAIDCFTRGNGGKGAGGGDSEGVHRFADEVFAQDRAEGGFAVALTGEGSAAGAFQLNVAWTVGGGDFA